MKAKVTLVFENPNRTHEKKTYVVNCDQNDHSNAMFERLAFEKYLLRNEDRYENKLSPDYHRKFWLDKFIYQKEKL